MLNKSSKTLGSLGVGSFIGLISVVTFLSFHEAFSPDPMIEKEGSYIQKYILVTNSENAVF